MQNFFFFYDIKCHIDFAFVVFCFSEFSNDKEHLDEYKAKKDIGIFVLENVFCGVCVCILFTGKN